jgi:hypothetical protein
MCHLAEPICTPHVEQDLAANCPFQLVKESGPAKKDENIAFDDSLAAQAEQENDGGTLGQNLSADANQDLDGGPYPAKDFRFKQKPRDTKRGGVRVRIEGFKDAEEGDFPYTVAAHHLIPGNASLYADGEQLQEAMRKDGTVKTQKGRTCTITADIGYDVNGSHNGVWLPGNYAIHTAKAAKIEDGEIVRAARPETSPVKGKSWSALKKAGLEHWQFLYVAAVSKAGKAQFHDTHENPYSESVRQNLKNLLIALMNHLDSGCTKCTKSELPPPFRIKHRLYGLSQTLRTQTQGHPVGWKLPWFTSERWSEICFPAGKITEDFRNAYDEARESDSPPSLTLVV